MIDRALAPLLDGDDAAVVKARLRVDEERPRLEAVTNHVLHPSAGSLIQLGDGNSAVQKPSPPPGPPSSAEALRAAQIP